MLFIFLLAACGGAGGASVTTDRSGNIGNPAPTPTPSGDQIVHPSCDGYPQQGIPSVTVCEERDHPGLPAGSVIAETSLGDLVAVGSNRGDVHLKAFVYAQGLTEDAARALASQIVIHTENGQYYATGPDSAGVIGPINISLGGNGWWVSFDLATPTAIDLQLDSSSGWIQARDLTGNIGLTSSSGEIEARNVSGNVFIASSSGTVGLSNPSGAVTVDASSSTVGVNLEGTAWSGEGLHIEGSSTDVIFLVPGNYNARFELETVSGSIESDFGGQPQGDFGNEQLTETTGSGGTTLRARTTSGDILLRRK
jgi:hypothetical protein